MNEETAIQSNSATAAAKATTLESTTNEGMMEVESKTVARRDTEQLELKNESNFKKKSSEVLTDKSPEDLIDDIQHPVSSSWVASMPDYGDNRNGGGFKDSSSPPPLWTLIPPDVFMHQIVGPYLTPKEVRHSVREIWPETAFDWETHCCPVHQGTVLTYFEDPQNDNDIDEDDGDEEVIDNTDENGNANEDDDAEANGDDDANGEEENQNEEEDGANNNNNNEVDDDQANSNKEQDMAGTEGNLKSSAQKNLTLTLRCYDCVMMDKKKMWRCDHCNTFMGDHRSKNKCARCPQIFCSDCKTHSIGGVCRDCLLCAFCKVDFGTLPAVEKGKECEMCSRLYCSPCLEVLRAEQDKVKQDYKRIKLAHAAELRLIQQSLNSSSAVLANDKTPNDEGNDTFAPGETANSTTTTTTTTDDHDAQVEEDQVKTSEQEEGTNLNEDENVGGTEDQTGTSPSGDAVNAANDEDADTNMDGTNGDEDGNDNKDNFDYSELNLPNLGRDKIAMEFCRGCGVPYCSGCFFIHQCKCCGGSVFM